MRRAFPCSSIVASNLSGDKFSGAGDILLSDEGITTVVINLTSPISLSKLPRGEFEISGKTVQGEDIICKQSSIVEIANTGSQLTLKPFELVINHKSFSSWTLRVYEFPFDLWGSPASTMLGSAKLSLQGSFAWASAFFELNQAGTNSNEDESRALFRLLSISQRTRIFPPLEEVYLNTDLIQTILRYYRPSAPTFPLIQPHPDRLCSFLGQGFQNFIAEEKNYELSILTDYYCRIAEERTLEFKFILASVFMESLKFSWARNVGKLTPELKASGLIRGFKRVGKNGLYEFAELMDLLAKHLGYNGTFTFIEDRNALFHTGAGTAHQLGQHQVYLQLKPELSTLLDQIDDLLLRILGYNGPILSFSYPSQRVNFPSRTIIQ